MKESSGYSNIHDYYSFGEVLGKGQFGKVKKGLHKKTKLEVAIKQIKKKKISTTEMEMLRNEIEVLKMCKHPIIVRLYDVFEDRAQIYIVMDLIKGPDLYVYLKSRKFQLSEQRIKFVHFKICQAVQYLQKFGVMHRDLKLQNIMMSDDSETAEPKLVDFGFAKIIGPG